MKFKILFLTAVLGIGACSISAGNDYFLKNYATCTPYKTVFISPMTGESFEKAIIGMKTDNYTKNLTCVYYKQTAKNQYELCERRTNALSSDKPFDRKVECKVTNLAGINEAKAKVNEKDFILERVQTDTVTYP